MVFFLMISWSQIGLPILPSYYSYFLSKSYNMVSDEINSRAYELLFIRIKKTLKCVCDGSKDIAEVPEIHATGKNSWENT